MRVRCVLVVGAGIAGSTAAYWLGRYGFATTVVERAGGQRSSGNPVDVRGPALGVAERMGVMELLRQAATAVTKVVVVDGRGGRVGSIPTQRNDGALEIPRSALAAILADAGPSDADFRYGDTVTALHEDPDGVDVEFERAPSRRFDLVVGADGLHSRVRRLTFGPEKQFVEHLGMYIATVALDDATTDPSSVLLHNRPGRAVALHPGGGHPGAAFFFRHPRLPSAERGIAVEKTLVTGCFSNIGWRVPELLARFQVSDDIYFDAVSRVRLPSWSRGRVVLLGDAASCVSLFGEGSSMAIAGAATLAAAVRDHAGDVPTALARYEDIQRRRSAKRQRGAWVASHLLVPGTAAGLGARNGVLRAWTRVTGA